MSTETDTSNSQTQNVFNAENLVSSKTGKDKSNKKILLIGLAIFLITSIILGYFMFFYFQDIEQSRTIRLNKLEVGRPEIIPLEESQVSVYLANKNAIDSYISKMNKNIQPWAQNILTVVLFDVDTKLSQNKKSALGISDIEVVNDQMMKSIIENSNSEAIFLDIREDYEREAKRIKGAKIIRFGDIVNNNFGDLGKDQEIIVICSTGSRAFLAANYLRTQGFVKAKPYVGGMLSWVDNNFPLEVSKPTEFINDVLPYISGEEVQNQKAIDSNLQELLFAPTSVPGAVSSLTMSDSQLNSFIEGLSLQKKYIIHCTDQVHCFEAMTFWDIASKRQINFSGFTGYAYPDPDLH